MRVHHRRWRAMRRPIVVLTVVAAASACAGHTSPTAAHATVGPATSVTAPPTTADPKSEVLAAYQRFWQVWLEANDPPNPNDPRLAEVATGGELAMMRQSIQVKLDRGLFSRKPRHSVYRHDTKIRSLTKSDAVVSDCAVDDLEVVRQSDGAVVNAEVATETIVGYLVLQRDAWSVRDINIAAQLPGRRPCE